MKADQQGFGVVLFVLDYFAIEKVVVPMAVYPVVPNTPTPSV